MLLSLVFQLLGKFSTLLVALYFFKIERIVDSGMFNNSTISRFLHPSRIKSMTIVSDHDLVPFTCDPSYKHTAEDLQMTSYNWKNSKVSLGSSQNICLIFLITLKMLKTSHVQTTDFRHFVFSRTRMRQQCTLILLLKQRVQLVEQELLTIPEHLSSSPVFSFMCLFCRSLFVLLSFFIWTLCCPFFFDIRILIIYLVSSNSSSASPMCFYHYTAINLNCMNYTEPIAIKRVKCGFAVYTPHL